MLNDIIKKRYSTRSFAGRNIDADVLLSLFEAARWSPSSMNEQPWRFIISTKEDPVNFSRMLSVLSESNRLWARNAPLLILTISKIRSRNNGINRFALYDTGQAVAYLTMQASHLGLFVRQMGGFDSDRAREIFEIPDDFLPVTVMAAGYKGEIKDLPPLLQEKENAVRSRIPLKEILFSNKFSLPFEILTKETINT